MKNDTKEDIIEKERIMDKNICELCGCEFEYDEGEIYDYETFVCFECKDELATQTINWGIKK